MQSGMVMKKDAEFKFNTATSSGTTEENELFDLLQSSELACLDYLYQLKWPNGFVCPYCGHGHAYTITTRRQPLFECGCCRHQTSLTAGTIMERSRTPLTKWFTAIRCMSNPSVGLNAVSLQRLLHVTYKTAWSMLHAIREAMSHDEGMLRLSGHVLAHSATLARWDIAVGYYIPPSTASVLVGVSLTEEGRISRVQMQALHASDYEGGEPSTEVITDFCDCVTVQGNPAASREIRRYGPRKHKKGWSIVKQAGNWMTTTFRGIGAKYRQQYLNEFCCRMNLILAGLSPFREISHMCARPTSFY